MKLDREWLMIIAGGIVLLLTVLVVAVCSGMHPPAPDDPPGPELQETVRSREPSSARRGSLARASA
jgi:hypothetical protein